jgi:hypothetical protein
MYRSTFFLTSALTPRPLYPRGKNPRYALDRRLGGPQSRSGRREEEKILDPTGTRNSDPSVFQSVSQSLSRLRYPSYWVCSHLVCSTRSSLQRFRFPCMCKIENSNSQITMQRFLIVCWRRTSRMFQTECIPLSTMNIHDLKLSRRQYPTKSFRMISVSTRCCVRTCRDFSVSTTRSCEEPVRTLHTYIHKAVVRPSVDHVAYDDCTSANGKKIFVTPPA